MVTKRVNKSTKHYRLRMSYWGRPWLSTEKILLFGHCDNLMNEFGIADEML